jgi:hypothetical protein
MSSSDAKLDALLHIFLDEIHGVTSSPSSIRRLQSGTAIISIPKTRDAFLQMFPLYKSANPLSFEPLRRLKSMLGEYGYQGFGFNGADWTIVYV